MKREGFVVFGIFALLLLLSVSFVSAQSFSQSVNNFADQVVAVFDGTTIGKILFGDLQNGNNMFATFLFFILLFAIVYVVVSKIDVIKDTPWVMWTITIVVSVGGTRFLNDMDWVYTAFIPTQVLGIVLISAIPLAALFYFNEVVLGGTDGWKNVLRRIVWILTAVVFAGMYYTNLNDGIISGKSFFGYSPVVVYMVTAVLAIIFMFMDKTIQSSFAKASYENQKNVEHHKKSASYLKEAKEAKDNYLAGNFGAVGTPAAKAACNAIVNTAAANARSIGNTALESMIKTYKAV